MKKRLMSEQDRRRWRSMVVFQIVAYGFLLGMFLVQLHMAAVRNW
jgi:hypothetical protein